MAGSSAGSASRKGPEAILHVPRVARRDAESGPGSGFDETLVRMEPLSEEQVAWYVGSGEGWDKAGAYAIQGLASRFISRIEGSYTNVVGLPVARTDQLIRNVCQTIRSLASGG